MQAAHFIAGDLQDLLQSFAAFENAPMFEHGRRHAQRGVEVIVLKTAQPRTGNRWIGTGPVQVRFALGSGENLSGMATQMVVVHFLLFSPKGRLTPHVGAAEGCDLLILICKKAKSKDRSLRQLLQGLLWVEHPLAQAPLQCWQDCPVTGCAESGTNCHPSCTKTVTDAIRSSETNHPTP
jgi:hypothetical protein